MEYVNQLFARGASTWSDQEAFLVQEHLKTLQRSSEGTSSTAPGEKMVLEPFGGTTALEVRNFVRLVDSRVKSFDVSQQVAAAAVMKCLTGIQKENMGEKIRMDKNQCNTWDQIRIELLRTHKKTMALHKVFNKFVFTPKSAQQSQLLLFTTYNGMSEELNRTSERLSERNDYEADERELAVINASMEPGKAFHEAKLSMMHDLVDSYVQQHILEGIPEMIASAAMEKMPQYMKKLDFCHQLQEITEGFSARLFEKNETAIVTSIEESAHVDRIYSAKNKKGKKQYNNNKDYKRENKGQSTDQKPYQKKSEGKQGKKFITSPLFCYKCHLWGMHFAKECKASDVQIEGYRQLNHKKEVPIPLEKVFDAQYPQRVVRQKKEQGKIVYDINEEQSESETEEEDYDEDSKN